jgi:hypothetical protein
MKRKTSVWVYWATLSLGDINTETWSSRLGVGRKADGLIVVKSKEVETGWSDLTEKLTSCRHRENAYLWTEDLAASSFGFLSERVSVHSSDQRYSDWLPAGRTTGWSLSPGRFKNYLHVIQTGSGANTASYPIGTGGFLLGGKVAGARS